jgi:hypothetical protein
MFMAVLALLELLVYDVLYLEVAHVSLAICGDRFWVG